MKLAVVGMDYEQNTEAEVIMLGPGFGESQAGPSRQKCLVFFGTTQRSRYMAISPKRVLLRQDKDQVHHKARASLHIIYYNLSKRRFGVMYHVLECHVLYVDITRRRFGVMYHLLV